MKGFFIFVVDRMRSISSHIIYVRDSINVSMITRVHSSTSRFLRTCATVVRTSESLRRIFFFLLNLFFLLRACMDLVA